MKKLVIKNMKTQKNIKKPQWQWNPSLLCCHGKKCILKTRYWERSLSKATTDIIFPSTVAQLKQSFIVCVCVCVMTGLFFFFFRSTNLFGNDDVTHPRGLIWALIVQTHYPSHRHTHTLKITHRKTVTHMLGRQEENPYLCTQTFPL